MINKNAQFNREKVPERVVHARGMTAKGFFEASAVCCMALHFSLAAEFPLRGCFNMFLSLRAAALSLLQVTDDITDLTEADVFSEVGKQVGFDMLSTITRASTSRLHSALSSL